jgi:molybdopterin-biosynthesis enzyme MoeA-like protein
MIITTGGLGPTVDDPTREAVALAAGVETEFRPELWEQIQARFRRFGRKPTENNKRQAYVPVGATTIENPVGTAPAFIVEIRGRSIICLPGVPREMEYLLDNVVLDYLRRHFKITSIIKARVLHTAGVGESQIDDLISDLERLSNPTVGLAAHSGQVDVRITAKAESEAEADRMIAGVETEVRKRLGEMVYGADQDTLEVSALSLLHRRGWTLAIVEFNAGGLSINRLTYAAGQLGEAIGSVFVCGEVITSLAGPEELLSRLAETRRAQPVDVGLGIAVFPGGERQDVHVALITPERQELFSRPYGGPPDYAARWAFHMGLDLLRRMLS